MGLFNRKDKKLVVPVGEYLKLGETLTKKEAKETLLIGDVEGLLDCVIDGKKLTARQLDGLLNRHSEYINRKFTLNKLRKAVGLEPINKEEKIYE